MQQNKYFKILARPTYGLVLRLFKYLYKGYKKVLEASLSKYLGNEYNSVQEVISILITPSIPCVVNGRPEIHSLVSHKHIYCYLLAIKSLLRFYNDVTVIVHDDGSLTKKDKHILKKHIKNINIIDRDYADEKINKILADYPNCRRYRDEYVNALQLFDFMLLCEANKIVSLDSDILFFKRPDALIDWLCDGKKIIHFWEQEPLGTREFLAKINLDECFLPICICLVCFYRETMNLDLLEQILSKIEKFDWWTGQSLYPILIKKQVWKDEPSFFDPSQYQDGHGFRNGQTARHYWLSRGTFNNLYLSDRKKIIKELLNGLNTVKYGKV
ncbi:MAG: hypothetical protein EHM85_08130 [Desulfobacteraceae bacterium]|nr:MAG: hypothetical protein EHM85_08130 [Desulfobacteraceae bacterium]